MKRRLYVLDELDELDRLDDLGIKRRTHKKKGREDGYVTVRFSSGKKMYRYRLVAQLVTGGALPPGINIHHINGNKKDDRPSNLYLCYWREHAKFHNGTKTPPTESNLSQFVNPRVA